MIRSPLAITVGHGLTGPPCPVGESVPCSSGLLIPRLRMTGRKRRPHFRWTTNPAPFRVVVFRVHSNRQGLPRRSCSHACCGHGMEMFTRSAVLTRSLLLTLARPPWWAPLAAVVAVACFLGAGFWRFAGARPILLRCEVVPLATCPANDLPV